MLGTQTVQAILLPCHGLPISAKSKTMLHIRFVQCVVEGWYSDAITTPIWPSAVVHLQHCIRGVCALTGKYCVKDPNVLGIIKYRRRSGLRGFGQHQK